jgi:hypothetical protein
MGGWHECISPLSSPPPPNTSPNPCWTGKQDALQLGGMPRSSDDSCCWDLTRNNVLSDVQHISVILSVASTQREKTVRKLGKIPVKPKEAALYFLPKRELQIFGTSW